VKAISYILVVACFLTLDFGFILDISPGGINFESCPFKLTTEMIKILGGSSNSPQYKAFTDICVRGYLASRKYADQIVEMVALMLDSSLPCFKGPSTLAKLRDRFQLHRNEKSAAEFMHDRIKESHENNRR
jgi:phosphatidylinositol 4-kinase